MDFAPVTQAGAFYRAVRAGPLLQFVFGSVRSEKE